VVEKAPADAWQDEVLLQKALVDGEAVFFPEGFC